MMSDFNNIQELEKQYSPSMWSPRMSPDKIVQLHVDILQKGSEEAKQKLPHLAGLSYGTLDKQKMDIFALDTLSKDAPIFVYVHGGYWELLGLEYSSFMAGPLVSAGAVVVAVGYDLAPYANMETIVQQVHEAVKYVLQMAQNRESKGVYLCGHSAGGHLVAMMLSVDWTAEVGQATASLLKGVVPMSGIYDLRPLIHTYVNNPLKMTEETAWQFSPLKHVSRSCQLNPDLQVNLVIAEHDSPAFHAQTNLYAKEMMASGFNVTLVDVDQTDHFDVLERLVDQHYTLTQQILQLMGLI